MVKMLGKLKKTSKKEETEEKMEENNDYVMIDGTPVPREILNKYFEYQFYRKIDPMFAYRYLVSSNAFFQAEQLTKTSVKMILDIMKPFKDEWAGLAKVIVLIIILFLVIIGAYLFIFHGGTAPPVITPPHHGGTPPISIK